MATEAAGEGINLQFCWFMINYDIPWNPVRLEQRMGRIHRYGQEKDCLIFNFVSTNTREGRVLQKLFERIEAIEDDLDPRRTGKVFNVLGDVFPANQLEKMLRDMYAHNLTEEVIKTAHRRAGGRRPVPADHRLHPGRPGQARTEPLRHRRQVGRGQGAPAGARGHRGLLRRRPRPLAGVQPEEAKPRRSHVYRVGRVPRTLWPIGERLEPRFGKLGREYKQHRLRQGGSCRRTRRSNGSRPAIPLFEAVREDVTEQTRDRPAARRVFYDLHRRTPCRLDVFAASIKDGRGNQLHRRLFVVQTEPWTDVMTRSSSPPIFLDLALAPKRHVPRPGRSRRLARPRSRRAVPGRAGPSAHSWPRSTAAASPRDARPSPGTSKSASTN